MKPIVIVTRRLVGEPSVPEGEVRVLSDAHLPRGELLAGVRGAHVVVTMFTNKVDEEFLASAGDSLRGVCNYAVGHNNIDLQACRRRGIIVTNTPDAVTEGTADIAWTLILGAARQIVRGDAYARSGAWARGGPLGMSDFLGRDLTGRTLVIVGAGRIGYATAVRSIGWGMRVLYVARSKHWEFELAPLGARRVSLEEGLREADVVSVHTPLTPETRHLIGERELGLMKESAIIVNTARGPIIDEAALARALKARRIYGAGLDVFENEPEIHPDLIGLENIVMTPHVGSAAVRSRSQMTEMVAANASAILRGDEPPNRVV